MNDQQFSRSVRFMRPMVGIVAMLVGGVCSSADALPAESASALARFVRRRRTKFWRYPADNCLNAPRVRTTPRGFEPLSWAQRGCHACTLPCEGADTKIDRDRR